MVKNRFFLGMLFVLGTFNLHAQENRYMVFFKDKAHSPYTLEKPEEFLSLRALTRREKQDLPITISDLPVSPAYLDSLKEVNIKFYHRSKWFNGVLIQADSTALSNLERASYIESIEYVAPGAKLKNPYISGRASAKTGKKADNTTITAPMLDQNIMLGVHEMHAQGFRGEGMLIGVFDGGFLNVDQHEAFAPLFEEKRIIAAKNFVANNDSVYDYNDHGTRALSCIAGVLPEVFVGTAPEADFLLCVTEDVFGEYRIEEYNWLFAAEFADSAGVDVINTSLGYSTFSDTSMNYSYEDLDGHTTVISRASVIAANKGIVLVTSAGNEGNNPWKHISAPADVDSTLTVGAVYKDFRKASFSSIGPTADGRIKPDVAALGSGVATIDKSGNVTPASGTSFAAPLMTGLVAGFWQANPDLNNMEIINRLKMSGSRTFAPNNEVGYGVPNFTRAMEEVVLGSYQRTAKSFRVYPNPVTNNHLVIEVAAEQAKGLLEVTLYNSAGKIIRQKAISAHNSSAVLTLNFEDILPGVYIINVISEKTSEAAKVIKF